MSGDGSQAPIGPGGSGGPGASAIAGGSAASGHPVLLGGPVTRDGARGEARRELSKSIYGTHQPNWLHRLVGWIDDRLSSLFGWLDPNRTPGAGGDYTGLGILAGVLVVIVLAVVLRLWLGPVRRSARTRAQDVDLASPSSADALRAEAESHAQAGAFAQAVRSRLRAIVRMLEEKGVLEPRASRTAGELVDEMSGIAPDTLPELRLAVAVFSEVWYGGRPAGAESYQVVVRADEALRPVRRGGSGRPTGPVPAVPA
jgi:hypothetical protein